MIANLFDKVSERHSLFITFYPLKFVNHNYWLFGMLAR
jgi:hypothetical protein